MFQLVSDGGCEFTNEEAQLHKVDVVPFYVSFDEKTYLKESIDIAKDEYFRRMQEDKELFPKTSQPNPQDYVDAYRPHLEAGKDILSLTISSKLSGTHNSATLAAEMLKEEFPDRAIVVIDTLNSALGQNLILREVVKMRDAGYSLQETAEVTAKVLRTTKIYFTLDTLEYLKKGGRVGPTTALVGGILGLRPVLHLVDGEVEQLESVRGRKKVMQLMEEGIAKAVKDDKENINLCVGHILSEEDGLSLKASLEKSIGTEITTPLTEVGATIGTHTGPGALAVAYCMKYETFVS
ncbi:MAG: DegV family protein [Coriobacteriia bacterium]|nr:DegV family protein [Coriobacteriia bacterium]MCL2870551.1 DegV family protein [Coriobacteriia bacterium]